MKVLLGIHHGIGLNDASSLGVGSGSSIGGKISTARANLGIYGLGQRRTLDQLLEFTGIALPLTDASEKHGNEGHSCANLEWVPYDASISPRANLFGGTGKADDLELEPAFPLRSLPDATGGQYDHPFLGSAAWKGPLPRDSTTSSSTSYSFIFILWIGGLYVWYSFLENVNGKKRGRNKQGSSKTSKRKNKQPLSERTIKDV